MPQTLYISNSLIKYLRRAQTPAGYANSNVTLATIHM